MENKPRLYEMNKRDVNADEKFRVKCCMFGAEWDYIEGYGTVKRNIYGYIEPDDMRLYILFPNNKKLRVLLDTNFNTVCVFSDEDFVKSKMDYQTFLNDQIERWYSSSGGTLPYPFNKITMAELMELYSKIKYSDTNYGLKYKMLFDNKEVTDEHNGLYCSLLSYIEFVGSNVDRYFINAYHSKTLGFSAPNVYEYVEHFVKGIDRYFDYVTSPSWNPSPYDFVSEFAEFLGTTIDVTPCMENLLRDIPYPEKDNLRERLYHLMKWVPTSAFAYMLLKDKGFELTTNERHYSKLIPTKDEYIDLSSHVKDLTTLLTPRVKMPIEEERKIKLGAEKINIEEAIKKATNRENGCPILKYGVKKVNGEIEC